MTTAKEKQLIRAFGSLEAAKAADEEREKKAIEIANDKSRGQLPLLKKWLMAMSKADLITALGNDTTEYGRLYRFCWADEELFQLIQSVTSPKQAKENADNRAGLRKVMDKEHCRALQLQFLRRTMRLRERGLIGK